MSRIEEYVHKAASIFGVGKALWYHFLDTSSSIIHEKWAIDENSEGVDEDISEEEVSLANGNNHNRQFMPGEHELPSTQDLKTNPALDPKNFPHIIPELKIIDAAQKVGGINNFTRLLYTGRKFKEAGLTPIYLCNDDETIIRVSAEEIWLKLLH